MDHATITLPGYRVFEYLLVLPIPVELNNRIYQLRKEFQDRYRLEGNLPTRSNITLASFSQYEMKEERLSNRLEKIAMGLHPIKIELKDFGSFPTHTIYINITSRLQIQNMLKEIRHEAQQLMKLNDENKPHFFLEPYLSIGTKLKPWQYEKGWMEYSQRHFSGKLIADHMVLMKRLAGTNSYHVCRKFQFQNLPVATKQGSLFF